MRSFSRRITLWIAFTQLLVMGLASYGIYLLAKNFITMEERDLQKSNLTITNVSVSKILCEVSAVADNSVSEIEANLAHPDKIGSIMERVVSQNPHIHSCGLSFVADYYPQKGHWYCPYAHRDSTGQTILQTVGSARRDYLKDDWFLRALKADSSYWSKPFFELGDSVNPLVAYLVPIHNAKKDVVGILGVDISLGWFSKVLLGDINILNDSVTIVFGDGPPGQEAIDKKTKTVKNNFWRMIKTSFIINSNGTFIAHPDQELVVRENYFNLAKQTNDTIDDHVGRQMVAGLRGTYEDEQGDPVAFKPFDSNGMSAYVFYEPIENTDWSVAVIVPWLLVDGIGIMTGIIMIIMVAVAMLMTRFVGRFIIRRFTKPLQQLADSANEVAKGNFNAPLPAIKHNDEIRLLRDSFEGMQHSLTNYIEELKATTAEKASIENELKIAHDIQMSMLPKKFPPYPERSDVDLYGTLTPAKDVGGDLFDFYIRDERLYFCIGDVSGKGVPASLVMSVARSLFRNVSAHVTESDKIVRAINEALVEGNDNAMFVTLFVGILDLTDGRLHYCNAGHNPPMLIGQQVDYLPCDSNLAVGLMDGLDYSVQETVLHPGDTIFLYTDGLNEAEDTMHGQFGEARMERVAHDLTALGDITPEQLVERMSEAVSRFVDDAEQSDDLTMLAIKYK